MTAGARERRKRYDPAADPIIQCEPPDLITLVVAPPLIAIEVDDDEGIIPVHVAFASVRRVGGSEFDPARLEQRDTQVFGACLEWPITLA